MTRSSFERRIALEAGVLLAAARLGLAALPLRAVQSGLTLLASVFPSRIPETPDLTSTVNWAVAAVGRRLPGTGCLPEALAAHRLLQRHGVPAQLRIGVQRPGERLAAHAWVESRGRVVIGEIDDLADFQPLERGGERLMTGLATLLRGGRVAWSDLATSAERFLAVCADQDLTGLVHQALGTHATGWPPDLTHEVTARARGEAGAEMVRAREATRALEALAAVGVRALVLKGTALAYTVYRHPSLRSRNDTDVLVRPGDRETARAALESIGYRATNYCDGDVLFRQYELQRRDEFGCTHAFDIHWGLSTQVLFADLFNFDELDRNAVPIPPLGDNARAPGAVDALLLACIHPAMHHQNEERLIWLYDVHLLAARLSATDWDRLADIAASKSVAAICRQALERAAARFGTPVPPVALHRLTLAAARGEASAQYLNPGRRWATELAASLGALGWRDRLRLIREVAFPAPRYMLVAYGLSGTRLGPALLPALYAYRTARGMLKVLTGLK